MLYECEYIMISYNDYVLYNDTYVSYGNSITIYKNDILKIIYGIIALPIGTSMLIFSIPILKYVLPNVYRYRY